MDFPHMVFAGVRGLIRSPAFHFALLGFIVFLVIGGSEQTQPHASGQPNGLSLRRVQRVHDQIAREKGRSLTDEEKAEAIELMLDREALYRYGREIGLDRDPVVQRRMSLIAEFVSENPGEGVSGEERAREAMELGLIESDSVTRRILIDGARRLIRATALVRAPDEGSMERHLNENPDGYRIPGRTRISHVTLNRNRPGDDAKAAAVRLLEQLVRDRVLPQDATELGDPSWVEPQLAAITDRALTRRFGTEFVEGLAKLPVGSWQGPLPSLLGYHIVYIHERLPQRVARLEEVREQVSSDIRNRIADQVLKARLSQLREQYGLRVEEPRT